MGVFALAAAAALLVASAILELWPEPPPEAGLPALEKAYGELWEELEAAAERAAVAVAAAPEASRLELFVLLERLAAASTAPEGVTLLLVDAQSEAAAWAGEGLRHELDLSALPGSGASYLQGFTAVTLLAVAPVEGPRRWRVVAGRSFSTSRLPFATASAGWPRGLRWYLAPAGALRAGEVALERPATPALHLEPPASIGGRSRRSARGLRRAGLALLGLALAAMAIRRAGGELARRDLAASPWLFAGAVAAWGGALALPWVPGAILTAAAGLAGWALGHRAAATRWPLRSELGGASAVLALAAAAWLYQRHLEIVDLGSSLGGGGREIALRLAWSLASLGLLRLAAGRRREAAGDGAAWVAAPLLLAAAAMHDRPWVALPLLALAGAAIGRWLAGVDFRHRLASLGAFLVLAALAAGVAWETAYRAELRQRVATVYLPRVAPPESVELAAARQRLAAYFATLDLDRLIPPAPAELNLQDLAYVLWRDSPLAEDDALSALVIEPVAGARSSFTFGLSLRDGQLIDEPAGWRVPPAPAWRGSLVRAEAPLEVAGRPWGTARYWWLPRPGFRLEASEIAELETALVGSERRRELVDGLPPTVLYGLYSANGRALVSPWDEAPPLTGEALERGLEGGSIETPGGRYRFWTRSGRDGVEVLYLPLFGPLRGLERAGVHALVGLALVALLATAALLVALPRAVSRELLRRTVRSYSKRLILVYAVLLLAPLMMLNLVLLRSFEERLRREQVEAARGALASARLFLLDELRQLQPGVSIDTQLDLEWVASVVQHPVNVYWGSQLLSSSQRELFTAGLLPRRIPGEIFSRLLLLGYEVGYRTQRSGEVTYLELYGPLHVPDLVPTQEGLFLSVPLLAEEEEAARELAALRRRALLVTTALVCLLMAVGSRLARSFTKPIVELIDGTRRIAAGAPRLEVAPREEELSALAGAIDEMARRIAEGRDRLLAEKQLVERIVDSIASGVVSLDHQRRVLLHNRVAAELLGVEPGADIGEALAGNERLAGVAEFLAGPRQEPRQKTLRIAQNGESREWTLFWVPLPGSTDPAALLVIDDVTEVVRGQRLEAWAEMARIIAHEIKNPLTPIRLSAEHLRQVYRADPERLEAVIERCVDNILAQVEELREIASDFSIYSRIPEAEPEPGDLVEAMRELVDAYRDAKGVDIELVSGAASMPARFDERLLRRAVRNLIENALRASAGRGRVELGLERSGDRVRIRVVDRGPGVDPGMLGRIFEPYFSTYESGTGLGLAITRRIVEEHGGEIEARNRDGGGLEVVMALPAGDGRSPGREEA